MATCKVNLKQQGQPDWNTVCSSRRWDKVNTECSVIAPHKMTNRLGVLINRPGARHVPLPFVTEAPGPKVDFPESSPKLEAVRRIQL